jgi:hypothetical protein
VISLGDSLVAQFRRLRTEIDHAAAIPRHGPDEGALLFAEPAPPQMAFQLVRHEQR